MLADGVAFCYDGDVTALFLRLLSHEVSSMVYPIPADLAMAAFLTRASTHPLLLDKDEREALDAVAGGITLAAVEGGFVEASPAYFGVSELKVTSAGQEYASGFALSKIVEVASGSVRSEFAASFRRHFWAHLILNGEVGGEDAAHSWGDNFEVAHLLTCGAVVMDEFPMPRYERNTTRDGSEFAMCGTIVCRCSKRIVRSTHRDPVTLSIPMDYEDMNALYEYFGNVASEALGAPSTTVMLSHYHR